MAERGQTITGQEFLEVGLDDWRMLRNEIHTRFATRDFATGLELVTAVGAVAEELDHHPDLDLQYGHVGIRLWSHDTGGVTRRDLRLAGRISDLAAERGLTASPAEVQVLEIGLDTAAWQRIRPFWRALLAGGENLLLPDEVTDPFGVLPTLWFQEAPGEGEHETPRQRFHLDIHVPPDVAEDRIAAALANGGTLVSDAAAPSFTVLADPDGNKACVCTSLGRVP